MKHLYLIFLIFVLSNCKDRVPPFGVKNISVEEAKTLINSNRDLVVIDVRTLEETEEGKLESAVVVDVKRDDFENEISKFDRKDTYLVYCRSGTRSTTAVEMMSNLGFERVYMMEGGFLEWEDQLK